MDVVTPADESAAGPVRGTAAHSFAHRRPVPRPRSGEPASAPVARELPVRARWSLLTSAAVGFAAVATFVPQWIVPASLALWLLAGVAVLRPVYLILDGIVIGLVVLIAVLMRGQPVPLGLTIGLVLLGAFALSNLLHRDRAGIRQVLGERAEADAVLIDLRDRAAVHSAIPSLPRGWRIETDMRSAHGERFCGDFVVATLHGENRLDLVLVDVSGKGSDAGGRALLFSGAFAALLDAVPYAQFLPAANRYVLRHADAEGFASAVHASVDLVTGAFRLAGAGHPPAAHYRAGPGRWEMLDSEQGPLLGVLPEPAFPVHTGALHHGDALLLYTDGLVENARLDVDRGIDRLIGQAEPVLVRSPSGVAATIASRTRAGEADDRALVVVRRS